ncbi:MAG TPA: hypothetical protein VL048_20965 [Xanthobacteraceae bacterium]|jgi:hypothetical protein|nr:hypothetical protein [Xanthobacteraceae bacterium]
MAGKKRAKGRKIEINGETAELLAARAAALGISVADLLAVIAGSKPAATPQTAKHDAPMVTGDASAAAGNAANAPATQTEAGPPDARWRAVKAWIDSWGKTNELPRPKLGK